MAQGLGSRGLKARGLRFLGLKAYNIGLIVVASGFRELGFYGGVFYPRGACTQMVYTLALKYSYIGTLGPKYVPVGYMDPEDCTMPQNPKP